MSTAIKLADQWDNVHPAMDIGVKWRIGEQMKEELRRLAAENVTLNNEVWKRINQYNELDGAAERMSERISELEAERDELAAKLEVLERWEIVPLELSTETIRAFVESTQGDSTQPAPIPAPVAHDCSPVADEREAFEAWLPEIDTDPDYCDFSRNEFGYYSDWNVQRAYAGWAAGVQWQARAALQPAQPLSITDALKEVIGMRVSITIPSEDHTAGRQAVGTICAVQGDTLVSDDGRINYAEPEPSSASPTHDDALYWTIVEWDSAGSRKKRDLMRRILSLYGHAPAQPAQPAAVPEGWQIVPKRMTREMREAFNDAHELVDEGVGYSPDSEWRAALAAAPQPDNKENGDAE